MIALVEAECCALVGTDFRPTPLRLRASRPQLKRDPLGGALPPHKHPFVNSFGTVSTRGAAGPRLPKDDRFAAPHTPRPCLRGRRRRARPPVGWLSIGKFSTQGGAPAQPRAARSRIGAKRAV